MSVPLGDIIYTAVKPIIKIYLIMGIGFYMTRKNVLSVETTRNISDLAITILLPCLMFNKIVTNISNAELKQIGTILLDGACLQLGGASLALGLAVLLKCPKYWIGGAISVGLLPNISDLPIAYLQTLGTGGVITSAESEKGVAYACIFTCLQLLFQFNLGGFRLIGWDLREEIRKAKELAENDEKIAFGASSSSEEDERNTVLQPENSSDNPVSEVSSLSSVASGQNQDQRREFIDARPYSENPVSATTTRRRRASVARSVATNEESRDETAQTMEDVVRLYSRVGSIVEGQDPDTQGLTELGLRQSQSHQKEPVKNNIPISSRVWHVVKQTLKMIGLSCLKPISIVMVVSVCFSMIPWVRALFVHNTQASVPDAPDSEPPLSFIMDFTSYVGAAQVPLGLLLLGGTISRLQIKGIDKRAFRIPLALVFMRLILFPVIGSLLNHRFKKIGLFYDDKILEFVCSITWGLPPATSMIYITALYMPATSKERIQIDSLALTYIFSYTILVVSLPFLTSYTLKVPLGY
ncbi:unnamed protein product [Kuraishia capsulata CBS 1993]|uniref:Auxin efflux carrier n=1 Tax=Kuraishia capsulata CBS 1993 TaxID=1382522 RepID=W6MFJ3_9ASCO|nr:uncharacterized protein KUCA_T00000327001 [Kuraishia capsulata CBS 1993]CDK24366.1 unnamed protein product [Kuraishia capsulata CBS 1993]